MTEGSLYRNRCLRGTESIHSGYKASLFGHSPEMSSGSPGSDLPAYKYPIEFYRTALLRGYARHPVHCALLQTIYPQDDRIKDCLLATSSQPASE